MFRIRLRHTVALCLAFLIASLLQIGQAAETGISADRWIPQRGGRAELLALKTFRSPTIETDYGYLVYLPPAYETATGRRFPVVYWLHGLGGSPRAAGAMVERLDKAIREGMTPQMIVVACTDPTGMSMWCDSKDGRAPVETVIVEDLIDHVDSTYRTISDRSGRAVEGFSMGGSGAAHLGFKYPDKFGAVSILAGALHNEKSIAERRRNIFERVFDSDAEYFRANSPWTLVRENAGAIRGRTHVRIAVGADDQLRIWNRQYHELLDELKIDHGFAIVANAGHNARQLFGSFVGNPFAFYQEAFGLVSEVGDEPPTETPGGTEYGFLPDPMPEGLVTATFRFWLPDSIGDHTRVRGVILASDYHAGRNIHTDPRWRRLAADHDMAMMIHQLEEDREKSRLAKEEVGMKTILLALAEFAEQSGHPEVRFAGMVHTGLSQSGHQAIAFANLRPDRTIAAVAYHASAAVRAPELAEGRGTAVPQLHPISETDTFFEPTAVHEFVLRARENGALWAGLYQAKEVHHLLGDPDFILDWLATVIEMRAPKQIPQDRPYALKPVREKDGWLAVMKLDGRKVATGEDAPRIAVYEGFKGDQSEAYWLPNESLARAWREYTLRPDARDPEREK